MLVGGQDWSQQCSEDTKMIPEDKTICEELVLDWLVDLYTKVKIGKKDFKSKLPDFNGDLHVTRQEPDALSAVNGL